MEPSQGRGKALVVARQTAEATHPRETPLDDPSLGQEHKAVAALRALDNDEAHPLLVRCGRRLLAGGGRIGVERRDRFARHFLHPLGHRADLLSRGGIGWGHRQRQERAHGIDHRLRLGAAHALLPVNSCPLSTLHRRAQRATIDDDSAGLRAASGRRPHEQAQIMDDGFKAPSGDPAAHLLVDRLPRRKVGRRPAPRRAGAHHGAHGVEHLAQVMATLRCGLGQQAQLGRDKSPFFITDIAGIGASGHPPSLRAWRR